MKKWASYFALAVLIAGCSSSDVSEDGKKMDEITYLYQDANQPFDKRFKDYLTNAVGIEEGENYTLNTYKEHLNDDEIEEIIFTINRKEFAFKQAKQNNAVAKHSSVDYFGNHNFLVIYNSKTKQFTSPIIFGSSAYKPLTLTFENIGPYKHKDMIIEYRIGDARFRKYFLFNNPNGKINYAFRWTVFEDWNKGSEEATCFSYAKGSRSDYKDIILTKAKLKPLKEGDNYNLIDGEIECGTEVAKRFFFNPQDGKYYTADL